MSLDDLQATIEKLKDKIETYRPYFSGNETATRQVLIDPLLLALGWDVLDPDQVELEYAAGGGRADYALKSNDKPVAVIEAKNLDISLQDTIMQPLNYANSRGIKYMAITNGDNWFLYDVFSQQPIEERILMQFSITQTPAYESALQALRMWRSNLASPGNPMPASDPVFQSQTNKKQPDALTSNPPPSLSEPDGQERRTSPQIITESDTEPGWISLKNLSDVDKKSPKPKHIKFPDGHTEKFRASSIGVLRETANWLIKNGKLKSENAQIPHPDIKDRYVASSTEQLHPSGKRFTLPELVDAGVYIEKDWEAQHSINGAKALLEHFGEDPSNIQVRLNRV